MQEIRFQLAILPFCLLMLTLTSLAFGQCPSDTGEWILFNDSCYKSYDEADFWYEAEMTCQRSDGHLVSIDSDEENRLVARLSTCSKVWIGNFGTNLKKLSDPSTYEWTDGKTGHEYSRLDNSDDSISMHQPLVYASNLFWHNSFYHEKFPFICDVPANGDQKNKCPATMKYYMGNCYLVSILETTFVNANFFCQSLGTHLMSVTSEAEFRFITTLDLTMESCLLEKMWIGLINLDPCLAEANKSQYCWEWTDLSGLYSNLPPWAEGEPSVSGQLDEEKNGCALIRGDRLYAVSCSEHHKFTCKISSSVLTSDGQVWKQLETISSLKNISYLFLQAPENTNPMDTISMSNIDMADPILDLLEASGNANPMETVPMLNITMAEPILNLLGAFGNASENANPMETIAMSNITMAESILNLLGASGNASENENPMETIPMFNIPMAEPIEKLPEASEEKKDDYDWLASLFRSTPRAADKNEVEDRFATGIN